jgi:hypothetical protein
MTIAVGIVAHDSRAATARALRRDVGAVAVNVDDGTLGCEGNHVAVLRALAYRHVDWCVVLEDDAQPVHDFRFHVKAALGCAPAPIVGLYLGYSENPGTEQRTGQAVHMAMENNWAWIIGDCLVGSVGYAVRIRLVKPMLDAVVQVGYELPLRITRWAQEAGVDICYTVPSLVDHADLPSTDCTLDAQDMPAVERKAWQFGKRDNWDTPAVPLGYCPGWSKPRGG